MNASVNVILKNVKAMTSLSADTSSARREGSITLTALRAFVAVIEEQSFSLAATRLGVTQPGISVQLAALERACGFLVCHRKPQIALTEGGRALFVKARLILNQMAEFEAQVRELESTASGRIRIGMSAPYVAMPLISRFLALYPDMLMDTRLGNTSSLLEDVSQLRIDVGVMSLVGPVPNLACHLVSAPRLMLCMPAGDPLAALPQVHATDLAGRQFILREKGSLTRQVLESVFAAENVAMRSQFELGSREAVKEAVAAGLGVTALFEGEEGGDSRFATVPFATVPTPSGVYAVALQESLALPHVRAFMQGADIPDA